MSSVYVKGRAFGSNKLTAADVTTTRLTSCSIEALFKTSNVPCTAGVMCSWGSLPDSLLGRGLAVCMTPDTSFMASKNAPEEKSLTSANSSRFEWFWKRSFRRSALAWLRTATRTLKFLSSRPFTIQDPTNPEPPGEEDGERKAEPTEMLTRHQDSSRRCNYRHYRNLMRGLCGSKMNADTSGEVSP